MSRAALTEAVKAAIKVLIGCQTVTGRPHAKCDVPELCSCSIAATAALDALRTVRPDIADVLDGKAVVMPGSPVAFMIVEPGCECGPVETMFDMALHKATGRPPGTEVRPLYAARIAAARKLKEPKS
jgi:hypothetical protein